MRLTGAASVVALAVALPACNCGMPEGDYWGHVKKSPDPDHLHWCNSGEPQWLDSALTTSTTGIKLVYALWDGLTKHDLNGLPEPSIATHWDISEDQRTFTFHLRKDARWSNGRPLTAHDFKYHFIRILHPVTGSNNTDPHWKLKNGKEFTENRIRVMQRDVGPFKKGEVVEIIDPVGTQEAPAAELVYSNQRKASKDLPLGDFPGFWDFCGGTCAMETPYATVPAGTSVTVIDLELDKSGTQWAYVNWFEGGFEGQGVFGWVPMADLDVHDNAEFQFKVRALPPERVPGLDLAAATVPPVPADEAGVAAPLPAPDAVDTPETAVAPVPAEPDQPAEEEVVAAPAPAPAPEAAEPELAEGLVAARDMMMLPAAVGIRVPDDYTLVLETTNPTPYMIDMSPQRAYRASPREAVSRMAMSWSQPRHGMLVSSGPYHMTEWKVRDYVRLEKSPTYWNQAEVKTQTITAYSMNDQAASANYYFQGSCDAVTGNNIPTSYFPILDGTKRDGRKYEDYTVAPYLGIYLYLINTKKFPNRHFRRALVMGIDREQIPRILRGGQIGTAQVMPGARIANLSDEDLAACGVTRDTPGVASVMISGELCYVPPPGLDFNVEEAKKELALAKKEMGSKFSTSFSLKFNSGVEGHKLIAEYIQNEWKRNLGLDVQLEVQEWKTFLSDTNNGAYDVARMGWILNFPDAEAELMPQFRCGAPDNRTEYCSKEFDGHLDKAEQTSDRRKRLEHVKAAETVLVNDAPIIPLYVYTQHHLQKPYVKDLAINLPDQVPFEKVWIDPNWKKNAAAKAAEKGN